MRYQLFYLILILLIISLIWTSQISSASKEELNNDSIRAAHDGQTEKVLDLIKAGADVNAKDANNKTAPDWAKGRDVDKVIKLLKSADAKGNP